jgi:pilus assembly protein CpaB
VTRGKDTTVESIGRGAGAILDRQAQGTGSAGRTAPAALSTLR